MIKRVLAVWGLAMPALVVGISSFAADLPPVASWIPEEAVLVFEAREPQAILGPLLSSAVLKGVAATQTNTTQTLQLQKLQGLVSFLELQLETRWREAVGRLTARNVTFAMGPAGTALLCVEGEDEKLLGKLHETVRHFAATRAAQDGQPERVASREYKGATGWTLAENEAHVIIGNRLLLSNHREVIRRVLDLRAEPDGKDIASAAGYKAAREAVGKDAVAWLYLDARVAREKLAAGESNPMGTLLLADTRDALQAANWLALGVYLEGGGAVVRAFTDGAAPAASKAASFSSVPAGGGLLPNLSVPGRIASLSVYRDLRAFYSAKDALFPERTSGLVFFENMMGIFFSGTELTDGILGQTRPEIRLVVAEQKYDPAGGTPAVRMPAFAMVMRLKDAAKFGPAVEEAWQKALGLINFTRGQKAEPGLVMDRTTHNDVKYSYAYYRPTEEKDRSAVDERYNYRPALALTGDYAILSSTDGLAADLIDAVKREAAAGVKPAGQVHSVLHMDAAELHKILVQNREAMIRKNMVEKGNSREQAENDNGIFLTLIDCFEEGTLTLARESGHPRAALELRVKAPGGAL